MPQTTCSHSRASVITGKVRSIPATVCDKLCDHDTSSARRTHRKFPTEPRHLALTIHQIEFGFRVDHEQKTDEGTEIVFKGCTHAGRSVGRGSDGRNNAVGSCRAHQSDALNASAEASEHDHHECDCRVRSARLRSSPSHAHKMCRPWRRAQSTGNQLITAFALKYM